MPDAPKQPDSDLDLYIPPEFSGGIEFVKVPHGEFLMGSSNELANNPEKPQHKLNIPYDFLMGRFPVTNEQFSEFVKAAGFKNEWGISDWEAKLKHPVVNVTWHHTIAYCDWLNQSFGKNAPSGLVFRLPTEAEWEKAARGTDGREYPWGNEFNPANCNYLEGWRGGTTPVGAFSLGTTPVGAFSPQGDSPYGVCDLSGNVWEWTASLWGKDILTPEFKYPYNFRDGRENSKAGDDVLRVLRGGSFGVVSQLVRAAYRGWFGPSGGDESIGFRVVLAPRLS